MRTLAKLTLSAALLTTVTIGAPLKAGTADWSTADIAERVLPGVVSISVQKLVHDPSGVDRRENFYGSGFAIDPSGIIVTNRHVVQGAVWISVAFADHTQAQAELVAACGLSDLAVLKINVGYKIPYLHWGSSNPLRIGDPVLAAGNPLGIGLSVSSGIVSALNRDIMQSPFDDYIQTDAAINHGNSGGPLIDRSGAVVGVNTALTTFGSDGGSIGIGYAIPSEEASYVVEHLLDPDLSPPGWIGAKLQDVTPDLAAAFGLASSRGFLVTGTEEASPARAAGLQPGDIVLRFSDFEPSDTREFMRDVLFMPLGQWVPMTIWRKGHEQEISVQVKPWPNMVMERGMMVPNSITVAQAGPLKLGLTLSPATDALRKQYSISSAAGVVVTSVDPQTEAHVRGMLPGDVILQVENTPVASLDELQTLLTRLQDKKRVIALLVSGKSGERWITLNVGTAPAVPTTANLNAVAGPRSSP